MTFFDPHPPPAHTCELPPAEHATRDGWRCPCGKAYVREWLSQHGESWCQWKRAPEHDEPLPQPAQPTMNLTDERGWNPS